MADLTTRAPFISIEGGEAVGKSTLIKAMTESLSHAGINHLTTFEPGGTILGQQIRQLFFHPPKEESLDALTELYLVSAARRHHMQHKILPALTSGQWVLCDRFHDSSRVYQGILGGVNEVTLEATITASTSGIDPDLTILLTLSTAEIAARLKQRDAAKYHDTTRFDGQTMNYHERLREGFLKIAERYPQRFLILDASQTTQQMLQQVMKRLERWIGHGTSKIR